MMRTKITTKGVLYEVLSRGRVIWTRFVRFAPHSMRHRVYAAREQEHEALRIQKEGL